MSEKFKSLIFLSGTSIYRDREAQTHLALVLGDHRKLPDTCNVGKLFLLPVPSGTSTGQARTEIFQPPWIHHGHSRSTKPSIPWLSGTSIKEEERIRELSPHWLFLSSTPSYSCLDKYTQHSTIPKSELRSHGASITITARAISVHLVTAQLKKVNKVHDVARGQHFPTSGISFILQICLQL